MESIEEAVKKALVEAANNAPHLVLQLTQALMNIRELKNTNN